MAKRGCGPRRPPGQAACRPAPPRRHAPPRRPLLVARPLKVGSEPLREAERGASRRGQGLPGPGVPWACQPRLSVSMPCVQCRCLSVQVISPCRRLALAAESRGLMDEWVSALKAASTRPGGPARIGADFEVSHRSAPQRHKATFPIRPKMSSGHTRPRSGCSNFLIKNSSGRITRDTDGSKGFTLPRSTWSEYPASLELGNFKRRAADTFSRLALHW